MQFTYRNPERSTDAGCIVPNAKSIIVVAQAYKGEDCKASQAGVGKVAKYSQQDNYRLVRGKLALVVEVLVANGWNAKIVCDDNALVDREAAYRAGIGWYGKNSMLLIPRRGSWFVIGSVITDAPLVAASQQVKDGCGKCTRCIDACPTGAIIRPGVVDANRCLAWLLQAKGSFPLAYRDALGNRIYGCDECQEVCPPNRAFAMREQRSTSQSEALSNALGDDDQDTITWVDLVEILESSDEELLDRFGRWYIPGRQARYLRRNALVALGNIGDLTSPRLRQAILNEMANNDEMIREHACWAFDKLSRTWDS